VARHCNCRRKRVMRPFAHRYLKARSTTWWRSLGTFRVENPVPSSPQALPRGRVLRFSSRMSHARSPAREEGWLAMRFNVTTGLRP
jgi:hypothetical protein